MEEEAPKKSDGTVWIVEMAELHSLTAVERRALEAWLVLVRWCRTHAVLVQI